MVLDQACPFPAPVTGNLHAGPLATTAAKVSPPSSIPALARKQFSAERQ